MNRYLVSGPRELCGEFGALIIDLPDNASVVSLRAYVFKNVERTIVQSKVSLKAQPSGSEIRGLLKGQQLGEDEEGNKIIYLTYNGDLSLIPSGGSAEDSSMTHPVSAASLGSPKAQRVTKLRDLLRGQVDAGILRRAAIRYPMQVMNAVLTCDEQAARDVYDMTSMLPKTSTVANLQLGGLTFNGPLYSEASCLMCFRGLDVLVLKALDEKEYERIKAFNSSTSGVSLPQVVPYELVQGSQDSRQFMIMPMMETTLEHMASLAPEPARILWQDCKAAVEALQTVGYAHNDIKPSNIGLKGGRFYLIDLGSLAQLGTASASTPAYVPEDIQLGPPLPSIDWWMLAMVLAERCCGDGSLSMGEGAQETTRKKLRATLADHLPTPIWEELEPKLH